jgi:hypothetical protein
LEYLLEIHGLPPGKRGDSITSLIYKILNGIQSTLLLKNEKLEKVWQIIDKL